MAKPRWKKVLDIFPLYDAGITKADVEAFWAKMPYRLDVPAGMGNCTLCFQKGKAGVLKVMQEAPELAAPWIEDERLTGRTYFKDISLSELMRMAQGQQPIDQSIFSSENLALSCACTT